MKTTNSDFISFPNSSILSEFCNLSKIVLPQIVPFSFGEDEVNFDDSVTATCSIIKGDLPLTVWWRFTESDESMSYNLTTNDGIVVTRPSQKISILAIDAVKARHRGNYTCFAQNKGGSSQFSTYLAVNGLNFTYKNSCPNFILQTFCNLFPHFTRFRVLIVVSNSNNNSVQLWRRRVKSWRVRFNYVLHNQRGCSN